MRTVCPRNGLSPTPPLGGRGGGGLEKGGLIRPLPPPFGAPRLRQAPPVGGQRGGGVWPIGTRGFLPPPPQPLWYGRRAAAKRGARRHCDQWTVSHTCPPPPPQSGPQAPTRDGADDVFCGPNARPPHDAVRGRGLCGGSSEGLCRPSASDWGPGPPSAKGGGGAPPGHSFAGDPPPALCGPQPPIRCFAPSRPPHALPNCRWGILRCPRQVAPPTRPLRRSVPLTTAGLSGPEAEAYFLSVAVTDTPPPPPTVDTTKTRSGPQRVRMSSGERQIGAAKGKQSDTEALCQTPPPLASLSWGCSCCGTGVSGVTAVVWAAHVRWRRALWSPVLRCAPTAQGRGWAWRAARPAAQRRRDAATDCRPGVAQQINARVCVGGGGFSPCALC